MNHPLSTPHPPSAPMRYFLVCNPGARHGRARAVIEGYRRDMDASGAEYECGWTAALEDATPMAREALARGFEAAVAVGGDGTINRVMNGCFDGEGRTSPARLGVLYAGTSPDFCRFHSLPPEGSAAVRALLSGRERGIDICQIRFRRADGGEGLSHFACSANIGIGPRIAALANGSRRFFGDFAGTLLATLLAILEGRRFSARLALDGTIVELGKVWNLSVGKNPFLASGLRLGLPMRPGDGRLFAFAVSGIGRFGLLTLLPSVYGGRVGGDGRFFHGEGAELSLESLGEAVGVEFDGDAMGFCPVKVRVIPSAVTLLGAGS